MRVAGIMAEDALAQYADQLIYLCSAQASSQLIIVAQRKVETQIDALKLEHVKIDGMVEENKPARAAIWKKVDAKPGTYPIVINMKTGDFWHGDELQAPQRHARALPSSPLPSHPSPPLPVCRTRSMPTSSRRSFPPSSSERLRRTRAALASAAVLARTLVKHALTSQTDSCARSIFHVCVSRGVWYYCVSIPPLPVIPRSGRSTVDRTALPPLRRPGLRRPRHIAHFGFRVKRN